MIIKKINEGYIDVPIIPKKNIIRRGLYIFLLLPREIVIKVGIYGEGVKSNNKTRFAVYRSKGKNIVPGNGSYKTMKLLNERLKIGDEVEVIFHKLPEDKIIDGLKWKVDLYDYENKLKEKYKETLWLM